MPKIRVTTPQKERVLDARWMLEQSVLAVFEQPDAAVEEQLFAVQTLADDYAVKTGVAAYARELERYLVSPDRYPLRVALGTLLLRVAKNASAGYVEGLIKAAAEHGPRMRALAPAEQNGREWS